MLGLSPAEAESRGNLKESCGGDCAITLLFKRIFGLTELREHTTSLGIRFTMQAKDVVNATYMFTWGFWDQMK